MYKLFIANKNYSSWSLRPWVLMRTLGIDFDEQLMVFDPGSNHARFRQFAPNGRVPCLQDGAITVWDSLAITEYLAERHAGVWPTDAQARAWARCAAAEMHSGFGTLRNVCTMNCGVRLRLRALDESLRAELARIDELWSDGIARFGGPYLAGAQFSAADAFFAPVTFRVQTYALPLGVESKAYAARILALPAMQDWYAAALEEVWREPAHEKELLDAGTITADFRRRPEK